MQGQTQSAEPSVSEIRDEIQRVLSSQAFRSSRASGKLLRYICNGALLESASPITEYTIAVDVFGKSPDFKESKDAIVRVEVHRLRKRLGHFYEQEGASDRVQIVIPTGRYVPEFVFRAANMPPPEPQILLEASSISREPPSAVVPEREPRLPQTKWHMGAGVALLAAVVVAGFLIARPDNRQEQTLDAFWQPVLSSPNPILLCVGNVAGGRSAFHASTLDESRALTLGDFHKSETQLVLFDDAATLAGFAGFLGGKAKAWRIASQTEVTYADLQKTPAVLVGLLNNEWTRRLLGKLRFFVEHPAPGKLVIRDRNNPAGNSWLTDYTLPFLGVTRDYAIVVRVFDPKTEQTVVLAGGISVFGTSAAGRFVTDPKEIGQLEPFAPKGWKTKNLEIVLSTEVIRGKSGPPKIEAAYFW